MPVAEQGASSSTASAGAGGAQFITSASTSVGGKRGARSRLSRSRARRFGASSTAGDLPAGGGELQRLAAGRGAQIERRAPSPLPSRRAGSEAEMSCTHQAPSS